jgi:hypothetical protein
MARKHWSELSPRERRLIVAGGAVDGMLRIVALVDLKRRPADQIRGPKWAWATAVALVNSMGIVPTTYFAVGRRNPVTTFPTITRSEKAGLSL